MGRASIKANKNIYQIRREELELSREKASDVLGCITPDRIEKIENERSMPHPDEIIAMAKGYKQPTLCNYYCAHDCPIGQTYVPEIKMKDLSQIVLELLASISTLQGKQKRLVEITSDGEITGEEVKDFVTIQSDLEKMSITIETLQLWCEKMVADGKIKLD